MIDPNTTKKIVISPFCRPRRDGDKHAKQYPYWPELLQRIMDAGHSVIQIGMSHEPILIPNKRFDLALKDIVKLLNIADTWISVDTFLPHLVKAYNVTKPGAVLWGTSDPEVFGYPENVNIQRDSTLLRPNQFEWWESIDFDEKHWLGPNEVFDILSKTIFLSG